MSGSCTEATLADVSNDLGWNIRSKEMRAYMPVYVFTEAIMKPDPLLGPDTDLWRHGTYD